MDDPTKFQIWTTTSSNFNNTEILMQNESKTTLIQTKKDPSNKRETSCSIIRYIFLCLTCLNYSNVIRFPRELERHGFAFLIPYTTLLFLIGIPICCLELSLGQFLGQGSANTWRNTPLFKGAAVISRLGALIVSVWIVLQTSLIVHYMGQILLTQVPFPRCPSSVYRNVVDITYEERPMIGQLCLKNTFLRSIQDSPLNYLILCVSVVVTLVIVMLITISRRITMRTVIFFGVCILGILFFQIIWQLRNESLWPQLWSFNFLILTKSDTWFNALVQVILSTQIGKGSIPIIMGKIVQKGDVIRLSYAYLSFNFFVSTLATLYFMTTYDSTIDKEREFPDLAAITSIYDHAFIESDILRILMPILGYLMIFLASLITLSLAIYTLSQFIRPKARTLMCLIIMIISIVCLLYPNFYISKLLDFKWTGIFIIFALILDNIALTWIYGTKSLSEDLEFSIGRPIKRFWTLLWASTPIWMVAIFGFYLSTLKYNLIECVERAIPLILCISIFIYFSTYETLKQIDYNIISKIREASRPAKDWGPQDPVVRHAWKNWKTACSGTNNRDFTLRRRGTKDWTNSIKKGQYSHSKNTTLESQPRPYNCEKFVFEESVPDEDVDTCSGSQNFSDYEQYFLHSFENIPIKITKPNDHTLKMSNSSPYLQHISRNDLDNNFWNLNAYAQNTYFNSTFLKDPDEFSTEL